jgi:hypothetical protein
MNKSLIGFTQTYKSNREKRNEIIIEYKPILMENTKKKKRKLF